MRCLCVYGYGQTERRSRLDLVGQGGKGRWRCQACCLEPPWRGGVARRRHRRCKISPSRFAFLAPASILCFSGSIFQPPYASSLFSLFSSLSLFLFFSVHHAFVVFEQRLCYDDSCVSLGRTVSFQRASEEKYEMEKGGV